MAILPKETQLSMKQILRTLFMLAFAGVLIMSVSSCSTKVSYLDKTLRDVLQTHTTCPEKDHAI